MKKLFLFVIVLFLLFPISHPSYAQTVTPTSEVVAPDSTNARINLTQSLTGFLQQLLNFHWDITINPADNKYPAAKNLPDLGQQLQQSGEQDLMPAELQVSVTPDLQPKQQTIASVQCITNPQTGKLEQFPSKDRITTKEIPGLKELTTGSRELGSYVTGYTQTSQNYNDLKMVIVSTDNTCDTAQTTGQKVDKIDVDTQNQNSYTGTQSNVIISTLNAVLAAIEGAVKKYVVTEHNEIQEKSVTPWIHIPACLFSSCQASDVASVTYDPNKDQYVQSGGLVDSMYLSDGLKYTDAFNAAVDSNWSISGNIDATSNVQGAQNVPATAYNFGQAAIANAGTYMNCTLMPADYQGTAVPDGACNTNWAGTSSCDSAAKLPDAPSSACGLCNKDKIKDMADDKTATVPEGIPPTMETILTKAGEAYHVPPSSLLAIMYHEGAFSGKRFVGDNAWTEANVQKWSTCGQMPNCNENGSTAQFPYGFFPVYFKEFQDAVLVDDPSRKGNTSICNFMDVTYAAAKAMGGLAKAPMSSRINITEPLCFNRPMNITKSPASCTDWSEDLVLKTHVFYGSYCPQSSIIQKRTSQGLLSKNEIAQDKLAAWTLDWYNAFLCK